MMAEGKDEGDSKPTPDPTALTTEGLLREIAHLKELLDERDRRYAERFTAVDKEFHEHLVSAREEGQAALAATEKAIEKAEAATQKAIDKAETANDKRFEAINELIRRNEARISEISAVTGG